MNSPISKREVVDLIQDNIQCLEHGDINGILKNYVDKVDYFNKGIVYKSFILSDKEYYLKRWPELSWLCTWEISTIFHYPVGLL
jgi:hypothetical protein